MEAKSAPPLTASPAAAVTPWGSHLGGEECDFDAKFVSGPSRLLLEFAPRASFSALGSRLSPIESTSHAHAGLYAGWEEACSLAPTANATGGSSNGTLSSGNVPGNVTSVTACKECEQALHPPPFNPGQQPTAWLTRPGLPPRGRAHGDSRPTSQHGQLRTLSAPRPPEIPIARPPVTPRTPPGASLCAP